MRCNGIGQEDRNKQTATECIHCKVEQNHFICNFTYQDENHKALISFC